MNRQVIPSMILSVLIVCFFSVLLYECDRQASLGGKARVESKPSPAPVPGSAPEAPRPALESPPGATETPATGSAAANPKAPEPKAIEPTQDSPAGAPPETHPASAPAATDAEQPAQRQPPASAEPVTPTEPPSPFTTTREGESLADVAARVYGSADQVDRLWRANRDLLPQRDSPLSAGAVLRTPAD